MYLCRVLDRVSAFSILNGAALQIYNKACRETDAPSLPLNVALGLEYIKAIADRPFYIELLTA